MDINNLELEIRSYAKSMNIKLIDGKYVGEPETDYFEVENYKDIFEIASESEYIGIEICIFSEDFILQELIKDFPEYIGKKYSLILYLLNGGTEIRFSQKTDWIKEIMERNQDEEIEADSPDEAIKNEELCKRCKKEGRKYDDRDYCNKCVLDLQEEAKSSTEEIKEKIKKDTNFNKVTSQDKAITYVKDKYCEEKKKNKFIALNTIAKDLYNLNHID